MKNKSLKPRNHVALAMIRSNKTSGAHYKNHKEESQNEIENEEFDELYGDFDE